VGLRKTALNLLITTLDGLATASVVADANGRVIRVVDTLFDPSNIPMRDLPKFSCVPAPETIQMGLYGYTMDSTYRIALIGFVTHDQNEHLFDSSEDVIEAIIQTLTTEAIVDTFLAAQFSIVEMGPILNEQWDEPGNLAYVTIPLAIQFVEGP
jgi:hypothetical protein